MQFLLLHPDSPRKRWQIHALCCGRSSRVSPKNVHLIEATNATDAEAWMRAELKTNHREYYTAKFLLIPSLRLWRLVDIFAARLGREQS
jgi:hypothetical protein